MDILVSQISYFDILPEEICEIIGSYTNIKSFNNLRTFDIWRYVLDKVDFWFKKIAIKMPLLDINILKERNEYKNTHAIKHVKGLSDKFFTTRLWYYQKMWRYYLNVTRNSQIFMFLEEYRRDTNNYEYNHRRYLCDLKKVSAYLLSYILNYDEVYRKSISVNKDFILHYFKNLDTNSLSLVIKYPSECYSEKSVRIKYLDFQGLIYLRLGDFYANIISIPISIKKVINLEVFKHFN